jgi:CRISPR-associated protein Csd1
MILQALKEYYDRKAADPDAAMAAEGWEWKEIPFLVVINDDGKVVAIEDTREGEGKASRAKRFLVPTLGEKKGNGIKANLLWENIEYLFGVPVPSKTKAKPDVQRVANQHNAFCARLNTLVGDSRALRAAKRFAGADRRSEVEHLSNWPVALAANQSLLLSLQAVGPITDDPAVREAIEGARRKTNPEGFCLVSGLTGELTRLEPPIKGVWGAQTAGANIIAVNNKNERGTNAGATPAFASYGKQQAYNSPVSKATAFAYTTALNHMLGRESRQRMQVGDTSTVFWASKPCRFEEQVVDFFGEPPKDDPDRNTRAVESLFKAPQAGAYAIDGDTARFYVLGLAPNAARIAIRFWIADTVANMAGRIRQHFIDTRIVHGPRDKDSLSLFRLLVSTAVQGKAENIPPNLGGDTMRAILEGLPYPQTLLQAAVRRVRAEQSRKDPRTGKVLPNVTYERSALIKACVNRETRRSKSNKEEELTVSLDETNANIGYRLGRLFAALEKIQQDANPGINATIRDKFYGAASSTPVTVFANLMRLKNHHLAKLESAGRRVFFEKLLGQIVDGIGDFPAHLALADQGRFAIGYYQQMQKFYEKRAESTTSKETAQ